MPRRADLSEFLRARRGALSPEAVGFAPGARRRTAGLRREEVALLAGVSVSWYTWLEQGRPVNASLDVLEALSRALRLDLVEHDHLLALAGHPLRQPLRSFDAAVSAALRRVIEAFEPSPAYVLGPRWDFLAWNRAMARLFPEIDVLPSAERNLVWVVFANTTAMSLVGDWENEARRILSQFRAETTPYRDDPEVVSLVDRLRTTSAEFARWWPRHDVVGFKSRIRTFNHPIAGQLRFEHQQLLSAEEPDVRVVAHLPIPDDDSTARLARVTS